MSRSSSPSDDKAPETVTFSDSRKSAKEGQEALEKFNAVQKQKLKEKRRAKDQVLKERKAQAQSNTELLGKHSAKSNLKKLDLVEESSGAEEDEQEPREGEKNRRQLEARMERAMQQATQENDGEEGDSDEEEGEGDESEEGGSDAEKEDSQDGSEEDSELGSDIDVDEARGGGSDEGEGASSDEDEKLPQPPAKRAKHSQTTDYLPDHLFASAFSEAASFASTSAKGKANVTRPGAESKPKKRKCVRKTAQDLVVGSRTIRTLPSSQATAAPKTYAPPRSFTKFIDRTLNLRRSEVGAKAKGWERRAANIGVMKRNGPAAQFVRS